MSESTAKSATTVPEAQIAAMLECRYGDGMVYLPGTRPAVFSTPRWSTVSSMPKAT